jgi:cytochrome c
MRVRDFRIAAAALILSVAVSVSEAEAQAQDAAAGQKVFNSCRACHSVEPGQNKVGPTLAGVVGRKAGSVEGFNYSPAMKSADIVWTEENLAKYLKDPKAFLKGNRMVFAGVKKDEDLNNLIAFLKSKTP